MDPKKSPQVSASARGFSTADKKQNTQNKKETGLGLRRLTAFCFSTLSLSEMKKDIMCGTQRDTCTIIKIWTLDDAVVPSSSLSASYLSFSGTHKLLGRHSSSCVCVFETARLFIDFFFFFLPLIVERMMIRVLCVCTATLITRWLRWRSIQASMTRYYRPASTFEPQLRLI